MRKNVRVVAAYRAALAIVAGMAVMPTACDRAHSKAAVQEAIEAHLKQRPGLALSNMTTDVQEVKFDGDKATAEVTFQSKQAPELKVEVRYSLRREGDQWVVESSTPVGGRGMDPHSNAGASGANGGPASSVPATGPAKLSPQASH
jgi:hypothetical protein